MKYEPRYIVFWAVSRYLTEVQIAIFKKDIAKGNLTQDRRFLTEIKKQFGFDRMIKNPLIPEDAWIYNYIIYDVKTRMPKKGLIVKYENQIVIPVEKAFNELISGI